MWRQRMKSRVTCLEKWKDGHIEEYETLRKQQGCSISHDDDGSVIIEKLALNEIFLAEKDAAKTSWIGLEVDGYDHGSHRSSGIMVSTGTGSSGWLYGAKRITAQNIRGIANELIDTAGAESEILAALKEAKDDPNFAEQVASTISQSTQFDTGLNRLYYLVREPAHQQMSDEGFCDNIKLTSELCDGQLCIDGSIKYDIQYGDTVELDLRPEYRLKCIKFV